MVISGELELDLPVEVADHCVCVCAADMRDRQGIQPSGMFQTLSIVSPS